MAQHPTHPPHPQFLNIDWPGPQHQDAIPPQPLQLENEYDIDPSRYDILQNDVPHMDRRRPQQGSEYMMNDFGRQQFGGTGGYAFTFPNPQSQSQSQQHFNSLYDGGQYYHDQPAQFPGMSFGSTSQSMPSSPYYAAEDTPAFTYSEGQGLPIRQHARSSSNPGNPGLTPTVRSFQGQQTHVYSNVPSPITPNFGSSPNYGPGMGVQPGMPYHDHARIDSSGAPHAPKRMRILDEGDGEVSSADGDAHEDGGVQGKEGAKPPKPLGACARCKGLKVKCEFKTDPDICKRCLNGGHECVIPGRKKRRAPPRRDLLLGQIREQAAKIEGLMKELEQANKRASQKQNAKGERANSPSHSASGSTADLSNFSTGDLTGSEIGTPEPASDHLTKPDVLDWIAKARESMEAFGGFINMGGPSVTKDMLGEDVLGWKDSSSDEGSAGHDEADDAKSDVHVEVQDVDVPASEVQRGRVRPEGSGAAEASTSAAGDGSVSSTTQSSRRKKSRTGLGREKLAILPNEVAPIGMLANLSLKKSRSRRSSRSRSVSTVDDNDYGVANDDYFRANSPGPDRPIMYAQHQTPYILRNGLVTPADVEKLFKIYFDYINPNVSLLDPVLYTAQKTYWRSPFLFTAICGISSKFYSERPELYQQAMNCARLAGGSTLIGGQKSVETVAAYILLALYPVPARKWEEDRCWVYLGLAIRIATDINLHHPHTARPQNEQHAREMLNRTRLWLNCFNVDRSMASQYGKAPIISNTDYVANHSEFWYKSSPYNIPDIDIHLCGYNAELKVLADYRFTIFSDPEHPVGLNKNLDVTVEASRTDDQLARLWETWAARMREENNNSPVFQFRMHLLKVAISYARMTALAFAFQHAFGRDPSQGFSDTFFWRCLRASKDLIRTLVDNIGVPELRIYLRHGPDSECVFVTFTCAFLIKLLSPRFATYIPRETRVEIRSMVEEVSDFLGSPDIAIDDRHGPKMYSRFLKGLLETPLATIDHSPAALKRAMRSLAASPSDLDHAPDRTSASPGAPAASSPPGPSGEAGTSNQNPATSPADSQMFEGLGLQYPDPDQMSQPVDAAELYAPPLPFDSELLQSMQALTESNWANMVLPGFNWMDTIQPDTDVQMRFNDSHAVTH
ncbi:hypothetical protein K466DRAFT_593952 [Polyporus arcularius HHB13444]|uniref:Zn(2)-C6 fungal-type domain-containing protein n=1 Tax=Polyporus arcularius HHB13444 TaxID=1314778 RepID=A0A5C3Q6D3_9APHY|nr:hypothetical protein K466DRAFT_593952 [Polyporus arcularius HHB13444]